MGCVTLVLVVVDVKVDLTYTNALHELYIEHVWLRSVTLPICFKVVVSVIVFNIYMCVCVLVLFLFVCLFVLGFGLRLGFKYRNNFLLELYFEHVWLRSTSLCHYVSRSLSLLLYV